ncbi:hypothetical protein [Desulfopila sp. IMCC35008]|uniref:hypothetical protein n=1 Tax=Desulfopila sp. IMCC35008 TaxID=2653858 RepID=UPI0013D1A1F3|nr:hypothetical protein [Desulfopila sp. IMCC35008]
MKSLIHISACVLLLSLFNGCSSEEKKDKPTVQEQMEQVGHNAAEEIKSSINKAELAGQLQEGHNKQLEEAAKE